MHDNTPLVRWRWKSNRARIKDTRRLRVGASQNTPLRWTRITSTLVVGTQVTVTLLRPNSTGTSRARRYPTIVHKLRLPSISTRPLNHLSNILSRMHTLRRISLCLNLLWINLLRTTDLT